MSDTLRTRSVKCRRRMAGGDAHPARAPRIYTVVPQGLRAPGGICRMAAYYVQHWQECGRQPALQVIDSYGPGGKWQMPWHFACACLRILADGLRGRIALLHLHMAEDGSLLRKVALLLVGRAMGIPVVVHMHGARFAQSWARLPMPLAALLARALSSADLVLVLGRASRQFMMDRVGLPAERVVVLANAVPEPARSPGQLAAGPAAGLPTVVSLPTDTACCRVLFLGALSERKGLDVLIEALASPLLTAPGREWHLDIAGNGESAGWRGLAERRGVAERITWHGWQTPAQAQALLARASLLVLPSRHEALPMAILEAMAHGLPVVATAVGDVADAVADGVNGLIVPAGSADDLAAALSRLIADPALRRRMGRGGRARFEQDFSISAFGRRLALLLDQAAARRPRGGGALRQVAALASGAAGGQALVMLAAPLLTRLYPAAAFGAFGLFSGVVATIGAVATLKYEQAILLEPTEARAADALRLCLLLSIAAALLTPATVCLAEAPRLHLLLVWGGPAVLVAGLVNGLGAWAVRLGRFRGLALYQSSRSGLAVVLQLCGAALGGGAGLLVGGQVIGQGLAAGMLAAGGGVLSVWRRGWRAPTLPGSSAPTATWRCSARRRRSGTFFR
jgi:glycosyltransferase involved in cell wall biosynthesis